MVGAFFPLNTPDTTVQAFHVGGLEEFYFIPNRIKFAEIFHASSVDIVPIYSCPWWPPVWRFLRESVVAVCKPNFQNFLTSGPATRTEKDNDKGTRKIK